MKIRILPLLAILFTLAIFSRAFALSNADKPDNPEAKPSPDSFVEHIREQQTDKAQCLSGDMLIAANKRMAVLNKRESEMQEKESAFKAIGLRLDQQLLAIEAAKASLDESVEQRTSQAQADLSHLTQMYKSMKPKQAAKIFNEMDVNFAAGFLREMKGAHAGLILSNMNTKKAYQISIALASRGAKYRTTDQTLP